MFAAMASRAAHPLLVFAALGVGAGCHVTRPTGYDALTAAAPTVTLSIERWKLRSGQPPSSPPAWALSDGRRARVDIQRLSGISGMGLHRTNLAFDVWIEGEAASPRLSCTNDAQANADRQARFSCRSAGNPTAVSLAVAPGAPGCITQDLASLATFRDPRCWEGELITSTARYTVRYAYLDPSKHVVHRLVWSASDGRAVQAVDSVGEWHIAVHRGQAPAADHDTLLLSGFALHLWAHAIDIE